MMAIYGYPGPAADYFRKALVEEFHYRPRADAEGFADARVISAQAVSRRWRSELMLARCAVSAAAGGSCLRRSLMRSRIWSWL